MTRKLGSNQIPDILELKVEVEEIKKMSNELYDRAFIPTPMIMENEPEI